MTLLFSIAAFLYSMAGHGGASAYTPLALASGLSAVDARGAALLLNLLVAGLSAMAFAMAGQLRIRILIPLLAGAMPFAYFGSRLIVRSPYISYGLGFAMLWAAWRFTMGRESNEGGGLQEAPESPTLGAVGAALGLLSGLTGVGGGIYLSPVLLFKRWVTAREAAALAACFIWFNSAASLAATGVHAWPRPEWVAASLAGGLAGAAIGSRLATPLLLRRALGCVLILAAYKALVH